MGNIADWITEQDEQDEPADLMDFLNKNLNEAKKATKQEQPKESILEKLESPNDIISSEADEVEFIVENILPRNAITIVSARPGTGKSTLTIQMAISIKNNSTFLGEKTKDTEYIVILDLENPKAVIKNILQEYQGKNLKGIFYWHLSNKELEAPYLDSDNFTQLLELPKNTLLIIDSLRSSHNGRENESDSMKPIFDRLKRLRENGLTILLIHHLSKGGGIMGSTHIEAQVDHCLSLTKKENEDGEVLHYILKTGKSRYCQFSKKIDFTEGRQFETVENEQENFDLVEIAELLGEGKTFKQFTGLIQEKLNISRDKARKVIKDSTGIYWKKTESAINGGKAHLYQVVREASARLKENANNINALSCADNSCLREKEIRTTQTVKKANNNKDLWQADNKVVREASARPVKQKIIDLKKGDYKVMR